MPKPKQAVVLIHGIGEQVPMETLRGFVEAVWSSDQTLRDKYTPSTVWSKPDEVSKNYELRRLTTAENVAGRRTDFFEFYWADLMEDTRLAHLIAWARVLLLRSPARVPAQLRGIWWVLATLSALIVVGFMLAQLGYLDDPPWLSKALGTLGAGLWLVAGGFLVAVAGDAARYLHVAPPNIQSRRRIRDAGIQLLRSLHDANGKYDRIIVAGHSLGSVIGYDILSHLWTAYHDQHADNEASTTCPALDRLEALARAARTDAAFTAEFQQAQADYFTELKHRKNPWLVTDFVTLGSPLAHAPLLMAANAAKFEIKKEEREYPTCPPQFEKLGDQLQFSFPKGRGRVPHHAAVFAPTRWTNLYFPAHHTLWGDVIGGPVAPVFGFGVCDLELRATSDVRFFSHTKYWHLPPKGEAPEYVTQLRAALRLGRSSGQPADPVPTIT